ncbi:MAG TPA: hypothetical protein PKD09_23900 [Aggregatilinea sp.]|uniref:hypothetical protein n=1 Tax=Aggregatilinea sp. TaxID=2806333 RepID=UPI002CC1A683|nr:hypothetical protein [Aggregatilinea sp.]HML24719.1 hypothetical protein [Aggregatilinea sp.]
MDQSANTCSLSERQWDLLRAIARGLAGQEGAATWWIQVAHDLGGPVWQGIDDAALRDEIQALTTLADIDAFERYALLSNPQAGRYELFAQRVIELVE